MNKYYIMFADETLGGPYSAKQALKEQAEWQSFGVLSRVLKIVVDYDGKEVK